MVCVLREGIAPTSDVLKGLDRGCNMVVHMLFSIKFGKLLAKYLEQDVNLAPYFAKPIRWLFEQAMVKNVKEKLIVIWNVLKGQR